MIVALALRYWQVPALVAAVGFGAYQWHEHNASEVEKGKALERARVADSTLAVVAKAKARVDTVTIRDSVRFTRYAEKTVTLHDTVLSHLTDTVLVKQFITSSDSTIKACHDLLNDCAESKRLSALEIAALRTKLAAQPATIHRASFGAMLLHIGIGVAAAEAYHAIRK